MNSTNSGITYVYNDIIKRLLEIELEPSIFKRNQLKKEFENKYDLYVDSKKMFKNIKKLIAQLNKNEQWNRGKPNDKKRKLPANLAKDLETVQQRYKSIYGILKAQFLLKDKEEATLYDMQLSLIQQLSRQLALSGLPMSAIQDVIIGDKTHGLIGAIAEVNNYMQYYNIGTTNDCRIDFLKHLEKKCFPKDNIIKYMQNNNLDFDVNQLDECIKTATSGFQYKYHEQHYNNISQYRNEQKEIDALQEKKIKNNNMLCIAAIFCSCLALAGVTACVVRGNRQARHYRELRERLRELRERLREQREREQREQQRRAMLALLQQIYMQNNMANVETADTSRINAQNNQEDVVQNLNNHHDVLIYPDNNGENNNINNTINNINGSNIDNRSLDVSINVNMNNIINENQKEHSQEEEDKKEHSQEEDKKDEITQVTIHQEQNKRNNRNIHDEEDKDENNQSYRSTDAMRINNNNNNDSVLNINNIYDENNKGF